jgi:hypothetical protein
MFCTKLHRILPLILNQLKAASLARLRLTMSEAWP